MEPKTTRIAALLGLRSDVDPERMTPGDMTTALNVRLDASGRASRRDGRTLVSAGNTHSLFSDGVTTLCVRAGYLQRVNADNSLTALTPTSGVALAYCAVNGTIYWSDGLTSGIVEAGQNRSWGLPVPQILGAGSTSDGNLLPGTYQLALTFVRADGQESGAGVAHQLELPSGGAINVTTPTSDNPDVVAVSLYLTTANGKTLYKAVTVAPGDVARYSGNGNDLFTPLLTQFMQGAMPGEVLAWMAGRVWVATGSVLFPSGAYAHELFDLREYLPVPGNVTVLAPQMGSDGLFVGTDKGMFYLAGADPSDMKLVPKTTNPVLRNTLTYVPGNLFGDGQFAGIDIPVWACKTGIQAGYPDGSVASLTENRYPLDLTGAGASFFDSAQRAFVLSAG
jgi:hypothetical protein